MIKIRLMLELLQFMLNHSGFQNSLVSIYSQSYETDLNIEKKGELLKSFGTKLHF